MARPNRYITEIDGLRGIAAAIVAFVFHIHWALGVPRTGPLDGWPVFTWLHSYGWTMVDLFFVISGFIFCQVYMKANSTFRCFFTARISRLYPLHIATTIAIVPFLVAGFGPEISQENMDTKHFFLNLLMLQETGLNDGFSFNHPSWSISVEFGCYMLFFILLRVPKSFYPASIFIVIVGFILASSDDASMVHIARGITGFFAGTIVWRLQNNVVFLALLPVLFVAPVVLPDPPGSDGVLFSLTAWPAILIAATKLPFLGKGIFLWLGQRSYSIYLVHIPVYLLLAAAFQQSGPIPEKFWPHMTIFATSLVLLTSDFSYQRFEKPFRKKIRQWLNTPPAIEATIK